MTDRGETPPTSADQDPTLPDQAEEITRRLLSGETIDVETCAGSIRELLPTMHDLAQLGRSVARDRGYSPPPPRKNSLS